jgi:hypothetical protein
MTENAESGLDFRSGLMWLFTQMAIEVAAA